MKKSEGTGVSIDMGNRKEKMENSDKLTWELALRRLEKTVSDASPGGWLRNLSFIGIQGDVAVFSYSGDGAAEGHAESLEEALSWAAGRKITVEIRQRKPSVPRNTSGKRAAKSKKKPFLAASICLILFIAAAFLAGRILLRDSGFEKEFYKITSTKIHGKFRLVQLSDLGNTSFGDGNSELVESVALLEPDLIVLTGNMAGSDKESALDLCRQLSEIAQIYYVFGENEESLGEGYREELEAEGVHVLDNEMASVAVEGELIDLYGVSPQVTSAEEVQGQEAFLEFYESSPEHFKIMVSSTPYMYSDTSFDDWPDLLLSGGTLGGGLHLPYLGVLHDDVYGFLPEWKENAYLYGKYYINTSPLIVSRGLTNEDVFRIGNSPELAVIDLSRY